MARPSKLSEKQWMEVERRHLKGEAIRALAREFKVSEAAIRARVSTQSAEIKAVAKQIVAAESRFAALPVSAQVSARTLADELRAISGHLASAGNLGAQTAHKLAKIANSQVGQISETASLEDNAGAIKSVVALTEGANRAAQIGLGLINANKSKEPEQDKSLSQMTDAELEAIASGSGG